ncbi:MFS transporter [Paraburkholderia hospita]
MGSLADRYGRKKMMLFGLVAFVLASLACGLAPTVLFLNTARPVKGIGAAMLLTAALAVIAQAFPEARQRTKAWAVWGMTMGIATTVAPPVGGVISQWVGWRWIFLLNLPVCMVPVTTTWHSINESRNIGASKIDIAGSALFGTDLASRIWALIGAHDDGWDSTAATLRCMACVVSLVVSSR